MTDNREPLGRLVRETWVAWALEQPDPKPSWLVPWDELGTADREVDMRIGHAVANYALTENAITWGTSCMSCARVLDSAYAETVRRERAEAQLAEVRRAIAAFFTHHGNSAVFALQSARDLAEGIRQVLDRAPLEPLSAVCTGPDCGEQFADSETSEYLFATRERMDRLLYADGWTSDPVLCPACQEEAGHDPLA